VGLESTQFGDNADGFWDSLNFGVLTFHESIFDVSVFGEMAFRGLVIPEKGFRKIAFHKLTGYHLGECYKLTTKFYCDQLSKKIFLRLTECVKGIHKMLPHVQFTFFEIQRLYSVGQNRSL